MPLLFLRAVNATFISRDDGAEYDSAEHALAYGVKGAAAFIADELGEGRTSAAIEICVEEESGAAILRSIVSMSVAPLLLRNE